MAEINRQSGFRQIYEQIVERTSVKEVMEAYGLTFTKQGKSFKTVCPFHDDHDPSLSIKDDKIWKCFVCGESGNAISFVQKYENKVNGNKTFTVADAMNKVIDICHLNINKIATNRNQNNFQYVHNNHRYDEREKSLLQILDKISRVATYTLSASKSDAQEYLSKRGFEKELQERLRFGYIPKEQVQQWIEKETFPLEELEATGFIRKNDYGKYYPVFGDRILIPITDERGNIVTFSGRSIHGEEPKYLHGQNTILFNKNNQLYNYSEAKKFAYNDSLYVVEGFMDVAGGNRIGMDNIVATMGTTLSKEQQEMIRRLHCEIVLMRDNDRAGKEAMVKEIPELLASGFQVSVVDLGKVKENLKLKDDVESKDLWDFANSGVRVQDLNAAKTSGFYFLLENRYFQGQELNAKSVKETYEQLRTDGLIKTSYDEQQFKDYVLKYSGYSRKEIDRIIHEIPVEQMKSPLEVFKNNLLNHHIVVTIDQYVDRKRDHALSGYYEENKKTIQPQFLASFYQDPQKYITEEMNGLKAGQLIRDVLSKDENYKKYEIIHKFQHDKIFQNTFVKNKKGQQAQIKLNAEQKQAVIQQYNDTFLEEDKMSFQNVEDLYIVNSGEELDGIIDLGKSEKAQFMLESMKASWYSSNDRMQVFSYGSIFSKEMLDYINPKYKTADGKNYKTILLFNNENEIIKLKNENLVKEREKEPAQEKEVSKEQTIQEKEASLTPVEKQTVQEQLVPLTRSKTVTIHYSLIQNESNDAYFVRIPNTKGQSYMYIAKNEAQWSKSGEILTAKFYPKKTYTIYDRYQNKKDVWTVEALLQRWADKTKINPDHQKIKSRIIEKSVNVSDKTELKKERELPKAKDEKSRTKKLDLPYERKQEAVKFNGYQVSLGRLLSEHEDDKYYAVRSSIKNYVLMIPKDSSQLSSDKRTLLITPKRKGFLKKTISNVLAYRLTSRGMEAVGSLAFNDLDQHLSDIANDRQKFLVVEESRVQVQENGFVRVPIYKDKTYGYITLNNSDLIRVDDEHIALYTTPYREYQTYKNSGEFSGMTCAKDVDDLYQASLQGSLDLENIQFEDVEREM